MRLPRLQARDLLLAPTLLSLVRLPLAVLFPLVVSDAAMAFAVLCAAGLSDVLDGWLARRLRQATPIGAVVDPVADKVFALTVVITLVLHDRIPVWGVAALAAREILELPLLAWVLFSRHAPRRTPAEAPQQPMDEPEVNARANIPGKIATILQFGAVLSSIALPNILTVMLVVTAISGVSAGSTYWLRALKQVRNRRNKFKQI